MGISTAFLVPCVWPEYHHVNVTNLPVLVPSGMACTGSGKKKMARYSMQDSLEELARLADTADLKVSCRDLRVNRAERWL